MYTISIADKRTDLEAVRRFWYEIYCLQRGVLIDEADHASKMLDDPFLNSSHLQDLGSGDIGGNQVTAIVDGNSVRRSKQSINTGAIAGDGIQVVGGTGDGSNNTVRATVSNNAVLQNRDDGIVAVGCGLEDAGSNNSVNVTITGNTVKESGLNADLTTNSGIVVSGASGEEFTSTTCVGNTIRFEISNNVVTQSKSRNITVNDGTGTGHDVSGIVSENSAKDSPEGDGILITGGSGTGNTVHDIAVSANQVSGNLNRGIQINGGNLSANNTIYRYRCCCQQYP